MNDSDTTSCPTDISRSKRLWRVGVSIIVLAPVTVLLGYGGWLVLTLMTLLGVYQPEPADGDPLRERLVAWPDRNREVMRTDGRVTLPLRP
jgi:hypothetical protein